MFPPGGLLPCPAVEQLGQRVGPTQAGQLHVRLGEVIGELFGLLVLLDQRGLGLSKPRVDGNAGQDLRGLEGLGHIVGSTGLEGLEDAVGFRDSRHEDYGDRSCHLLRLQYPTYCQPVPLGQHHVQQDEVGLL